MITSPSITAITEAVIGFHELVRKIKKDSSNPFFKSKYADLPAILDSIRDPLLSNGLALLQFPEAGNMLTVRLIHKSGEWMQSIFDINPVPDQFKEKDRNNAIVWRGDTYITPQAMGSAITYARRYAIAAILNLNIDEDDDGNKGSARETLGEIKKTLPTIPVPRAGSMTKKPLINKTQWEKALIRIDKGEKDVITKLQESFTLSAEQTALLNKKK